MGLSKPFAFMGAGDGGWDPTVGGSLSVQHHWDFTDTDTMTFGGTGVSGSEVATITDKVGSVTFQPVNGPAGNATKITTTGSFDTNYNATFLSGSPYQNYNGGTYNWKPSGMGTDKDFTVVAIAKNQRWEEYGDNWPRSLWYTRALAANGYDNLNVFMLFQQTWVTTLCSGSGNYRWGAGIYTGAWTAHRREYADPLEYSGSVDPSVYTLGFTQASDTYLIQRNDEVACTFSKASTLNASGEGLCIGGAPIGFNEKNGFEGWMYHFVVYDQSLTTDQIDDVYNSWDSFYNG